MSNLLGTYKNGNYRVFLYDDGTKVRETAEDDFLPDRPECIDVGISTKCNHGCDFCYMGCSLEGKWADFSKFAFLNNLPKLLEVNVNLNFPINPDLVPFLEKMKAQGVIVNGTVQEMHFIQHYSFLRDLTEKELIHGLGISFRYGSQDLLRKIATIPNAVVHVIAGLFDKEDYAFIKGKGIKLLILGYKEIGRGKEYKEECSEYIRKNITWLKRKLPKMTDDIALISFDNLALEQLKVKKWVDPKVWEKAYLGPDAMTSFYLDLVNRYYAPNSLSDDHRKIGEKSLQEMFDDIRGSCD